MTVVAEPPVQPSSDAEPPEEVTAAFPYANESAGQARRLVRDVLHRWKIADLIDSAVLVASELMTNAIQTGCRRHIVLTLKRLGESAVRISVEDGSCYPPVLIQASVPANPDRVPAGGHGLVIVDQLSRRWGLDLRPRGKCVYAEIHGPRRLPR
ncbi:ATP-binding protein [Kitasatospora sp. NPDC088134]|uniref:ATP-binding protein n=1 Tax=Kitasatospora sp. NPDC088134 TaxID=3364071 RepID=UPI003820815C